MFKSKSRQAEDPRVRAIREQIRNGRSPELGFLHIPKTGGSGVARFGRRIVARGYRFPCVFGHGWKVEQILTHFPEMRLCFILRDPLSKMISGFNSRLRQGRPTYNRVWSPNSLWSPAEAAAFAMLPSARDLLDAILSEDEFRQSSLAYAMHAIRHLRWDYPFYFKDVATVRARSDRFALIGDISNVAGFIERIAILSGVPAGLAAELYEKRHEAGGKSGDPLAELSAEQIERIRLHLRKDYRIHRELLAIGGHGPQPS